MSLNHKSIEYTVIHPHGGEEPRTGRIWAQAPTTARGRAFWVLPDNDDYQDPDAPTPGWAVDLVIIASRRHRVGRYVTTITPTTPRRPIPFARRFSPLAGRWIDKGTRYAESHPEGSANASAARQGAALAARRHAVSDDRPVSEYWPTFATLADDA